MLRYLLILILYYWYSSEDIPINELVLIIPKNETDIYHINETDIYHINETDIYPINVKYTFHRPLYVDYI